MATKLGTIVADFTTSLASAMAIGATSATLQSATDDDGVALPAGTYFFAIDGNNSQKEHIVATLSGTSLTSISSISRQGVQTSGTLRSHRTGSTVTLTDFAHIRYINDLLSGATGLNSAAPLAYDGTASITLPNQIATKAYVDGVAISGGANASSTIKGISKLSLDPVSPTAPIAVGDNDGRVPTQNENDALVGTSGTSVSSSNKLVDNADTSTTGTGSKIPRGISGVLDPSWIPPIALVTAAQGVLLPLTAGEALNGVSTPIAVSIDLGSTTADSAIAGGINANSVSNIQAQATWFGQGLVIPTGYNRISKASLYITRNGSPVGNMVVDVYAVDGSGFPTGASLGTSNTVAAASFSSGASNDFTFATPVTVTEGTTYAFVLHFSSVTTLNGSNYVSWSINPSDSFTGVPSTSSNSGSTWSANGTADMCITISGYFASSAAGRVIRASTNQSNRKQFVGFVTSSVANAASVNVQSNGIVSGFTGLTAGTKYYVSDTITSIGTSAGSLKILCGIAVSTTQLLVLRQIVDASL